MPLPQLKVTADAFDEETIGLHNVGDINNQSETTTHSPFIYFCTFWLSLPISRLSLY